MGTPKGRARKVRKEEKRNEKEKRSVSSGMGSMHA